MINFLLIWCVVVDKQNIHNQIIITVVVIIIIIIEDNIVKLPIFDKLLFPLFKMKVVSVVFTYIL